MHRLVLTLLVLSALVVGGCGEDRDQTTATTAPEPAAAFDLRYADVAGDYTAASQALLEQGREVVDRLLAGDIASVYEQFAPDLKAQVSLEEVERLPSLRGGPPRRSAPGPRNGSSPSAPGGACTSPTTPVARGGCASGSGSTPRA